ncbi:MAG TPA: hypothetical protein VG820_09540 [Fimbriimonadaceae bacterium]|nr:hypothetical protein [Fimbriimonadaceae bacterium]
MVILWLLCVWSLGWLNNRYTIVARPAWIGHPVTRGLLACGFFTFVAAWPFGMSQDDLVRLSGIPLAPAIGITCGLICYVALVLAEARKGPTT